MTTREASLGGTSLPEQSGSANPQGGRTLEDVDEQAAAARAGQDGALAPEVSALVGAMERFLTEKEPPPTRLKRFLSHNLVIVLVSGVIGAGLTHWYTLRQKEIDHERSLQQMNLTSARSFSDELNQVRVQKIGEVWETIDKNEVALDDLLSKANQGGGSNRELFDKIESLIEEDIMVINKNRFWLGKDAYGVFNGYLSKTRQIVFDMLLGPPGIEVDLSELHRSRAQAKQDIEHVRGVFSGGQPCPDKQPTQAGQ